MGSVKDLNVIESPTINSTGTGQFHFSDRYSVFDWGEMPDLITDKGKALCIIGAYFFEKIEKLGIKTHYKGLVENGKIKQISELTAPADTMHVSLVRVLKPGFKNGEYDYSLYNQREKNFLIPLEVIYRNSLPAGSSVFRRIQNGSLKLADIGLTEMPNANDVLNIPILDVSTKLEITDRYMSWHEAQNISAISTEELHIIQATTQKINNIISDHCRRVGLVNEDGKVEYAYDTERNLMLVDILGTPDECRFTYQGMQVSKEVARNYYRNTDWYHQVEQAKERDRANWKSLVADPPALPVRLHELIGLLYQSTCNEITGREWFKTPDLKIILDEIQDQIKA